MPSPRSGRRNGSSAARRRRSRSIRRPTPPACRCACSTEPSSPFAKCESEFSFVVALADAKDMSVRMADVHLPNAPRLVGRRVGHLDSLRDAGAMNDVDVLDPDAQSYADTARGEGSLA